MIPPTLDELVADAEAVIRTRVLDTRCEWRGEGEQRRIVTLVSFAVDESIVGRSGETLDLEFLGGELDGERWFVAGQPRFAPGHEDVLFVSRERSVVTPLVRMMYGRYLVAEDVAGRQIMARANGAPLVAEDQITAPLGQPPQGEALAMAMTAAFTPEQFAETIRASARRVGRTDVVPAAGGTQQ